MKNEAYYNLSPYIRALYFVWAIAMLLGALYVFVQYIQYRRKPGCHLRIILIIAFVYLIIQEGAIAVYKNLAPERISYIPDFLINIPESGMNLSMFILSLIIIFLIYEENDWQSSHINTRSVKESMDAIPVGLLYFWEGGIIKLINPAMQKIVMRMHAGGVGEPEDMYRILFETPIQIFEGIGVLQFFCEELRFSEGNTERKIFEIRAYDISEEYELRKSIEDRMKQLKVFNIRLKEFNARLDENTKMKEILEGKIRIHDRMGRAMIAGRRYIEGRLGEDSLDDICDMWGELELLSAGDHSLADNRIYEDIENAAEAIGIRIKIKNSIGKPGRCAARLLNAAARECLTNAVKYAEARELCINLESKDFYTTIEFTNDGHIPKREIKEGGGLSSLRAIVESEGCEMRIESRPVFKLTVLIPNRYPSQEVQNER